MKAVLIMDMPVNCCECEILSSCPIKQIPYEDNVERHVDCPLKELPSEREVSGRCKDDDFSMSYKTGWNTCLNKLLN